MIHIGQQYQVMLYVLFWIVRINGCIRRGRQPFLRGPAWFFSVSVPPGFYTGEGKQLLHRYWMRMLIPFAVDVPLAIAIFRSGHLTFLSALVLGLCALIHINHSCSVDLAERQARPFAVREAERPVATLVLSLTPRRLRDYTNGKLEWAMALCTMGALAWLLRYYLATPEHHDLRLVFGVPALYLYLQAGMLLVKSMVVAWRTPLPQSQTGAHLDVREETRKYYVKVCDWCRAVTAAAIFFWPVLMSTSAAASERLLGVWLGACLVLSLGLTVWIEIKRKQLVTLALRARPVKLPDFLDQPAIARWPVCYQSSVPLLVLRGARGYSLNLANRLTGLGAAYLAGLVALFVLLPKGH